MSVKRHDAFCLDNTQNQVDGFDHFWGDSLDARWRNQLSGNGTGGVIDGVDGGIFRLGTPTASDASTLDWGDIRTLHVNKKITMEARIRANGGVTDTYRQWGIIFDGNTGIKIYHSTDGAALTVYCRNGGVTTSINPSINIDADFHIYKIECFPVGEVHFYYDGTEMTNSPITTNIPDDAGDYLQPYFTIVSNADTDPATSMDIDYIWWRMNR